MPIDRKKLHEVLLQLGFTEVQGKDHIFLEFQCPNRVIRTKISRGSKKDIGDALLSHILRNQIFLTKREFRDAATGKLSRGDYINLLKKKGISE